MMGEWSGLCGRNLASIDRLSLVLAAAVPLPSHPASNCAGIDSRMATSSRGKTSRNYCEQGQYSVVGELVHQEIKSIASSRILGHILRFSHCCFL